MAGKRKLEHFAEMKTFPHVFEPALAEVFRTDYQMKSNWRKDFFKNDNPIIVELGCGKGEYSIGMAAQNPDKNYIGVDIKGARMWRGAKTALEENLGNVAFLRTRIEFISSCFGKNEVDEIWITFPDPQMKDKRAKKRLTGRLFIQDYLKFLKPEGKINLKTDSRFLYDFTKEEIEEHKYQVIHDSANLYEKDLEKMNPEMQKILSIKTHYEELFSAKGHKIHFLSFQAY